MAKAPSKTDLRREDLRTRLTDQAERVIATQGLAALKARDLAAEAGCSVGAIYNVFADLNELVMTVNGRTFRRLGAAVTASTSGRDLAPRDCLITMSQAYLHFAAGNTKTWRALFDLEMSVEAPVPDWYLAELAALFALISAPLERIFPHWPAQQIDLMTRALFSSVHGIVLLGLEKRISGVPVDRIEQMIAVVLGNLTAEPGSGALRP
ncbi:MAG: TetR/AcrR family transcriptional regulator [Paracoccaceae bacterium]